MRTTLKKLAIRVALAAGVAGVTTLVNLIPEFDLPPAVAGYVTLTALFLRDLMHKAAESLGETEVEVGRAGGGR